MNPKRVPQAGAVAFRVVGGRPEILLVRARRSPSHWIFPKGHLHRREEPRAAALRELAEEAGVVGEVIRPLVPTLTFASGNEEVEVEYFLVLATGEVEPEEEREKVWLAPDDAVDTITHPDAQTLLRSALPDISAAARRM
jgi:8-oxo-dGTP pyrophosphatase MutT (NUDIX family)